MKRKRIKINEKVLVYISNVNNFVHNSENDFVNQSKTKDIFEDKFKTNKYGNEINNSSMVH